MATSLDSTAGGRTTLRRLTDVRLSLSAKIFIGNLVTVGATLALLFGLGQRGWFAQPENQWVLVVAILVPASGVAWLISRRLTRNLETLMRAARAISTGDLSEAVAVNDDPQWADEIDVLAGTTATMLGNLRDLVAHLQRTAARVKASSSALVEATDAVGQQASGVLEQVASIAQRSEGQAERAEQQGTILDRMATDLRRSADIADEAARSTQDTSAAATRGTETSRQALGRMRNVFERVDDAGDAVYRLSERTAEIHAIVQAITQIAEQTHLLSINASIEAARAGDAGRGFAVVAEEIRRLADSSARSAEQINVIVTGIDDHTRSVVNTMRESTRELGEGRKHIDDISRTLDTIVDATHREAEKVSSLSELTRTQLELAVEVVAVADDVRRGAERIAEATRTVEAASSEQRRRSVTLEDSARTLSDLAAELDSVAGGFRLIVEPTPDDGRRFLVSDLGIARLGFDLARITEVLPLTHTARVPWAPAWVHGVLNHQGRLLTVVDLARFLEVGDPRPARVAAVVDQPSLNVALAVGTVAIVEARNAVRVTELKYYLPQSDWVVEALSTPDLNFHHLDVDRVVRGIVEAF